MKEVNKKKTTKAARRRRSFETRFKEELSKVERLGYGRLVAQFGGEVEPGEPTDFEALYTANDEDVELRWLFETNDLDPKDPVHWRLLITAFAKAYYLRDGRTGEWPDECLAELYFDHLEIKKMFPLESKSNLHVAIRLKEVEPFKTKYRDDSVKQLRLKIPDSYEAHLRYSKLLYTADDFSIEQRARLEREKSQKPQKSRKERFGLFLRDEPKVQRRLLA